MSVRSQMAELRARRDQLNAEVARLKKLRNAEVERARALQDRIRAVNREMGRLGEFASLEELERRFRELEWRHQTTPTTLEEERTLLDELSRIAQAMRMAARKDQLVGGSHADVEGLWRELEEARRRAQEFHEQMVAVVEQAQREHQKLVQLAETIRPNLEEEKEAHQQFLQCLAEADELQARIDELRREEAELIAKLEGLRAKRREQAEERERRALEALAARAREKKRAGKPLTLEEMRALLETGGLE